MAGRRPAPKNRALATRVIVADDESVIRMGLRAMLQDAGHQVVGEASTANEVFELVERSQADLVLLDVKMPGVDALEAARRLWKEFALPVVFVTAFSDRELIGRATDTGAFAYVVKPVREEQLRAAITVTMARWADLKQALEALETRKLVERAKGVLMKRFGIGEEEAHLLLHRQSRNMRKTVRKVAEALLTSEMMPPRGSAADEPRPPR